MHIGRMILAGMIGGLDMEAYSLVAWLVLPYVGLALAWWHRPARSTA